VPDITDIEKSEIREIAKNYAHSLLRIPFNEGFIVYSKTDQALYIHPARWKICLKCGIIDKKEKMLTKSDLDRIKDNKKKDLATKHIHRCFGDMDDFPLITQTSWIKLKNFFLSSHCINILEETGIDRLPKPSIITEIKRKQKAIQEKLVPSAVENN